MAVGTFIAGKFGRVQVSGVALLFEEWRVEAEVEDIKTPHFELATDAAFGQFWMERLAGIADASIVVSGFYDDTAGRKVYRAPVGMWPGASVAVSLAMTKNSAKLWTFPCLVLRSANTTRATEAARLEKRLAPNGIPTATPA